MWRDKLVRQFTLKNMLLLITYIFVLVIAVLHFESLLSGIGKVFSLLKPFIVGFALAYIFNIPMHYFESKLPEKIKKGRKLIAAALALICIGALFTFVGSVVVPQLIDSIASLIEEFPQYAASSEKMLLDWMETFGIEETIIEKWNAYSSEIEKIVLDFAQSILPKIVELTGGAVSIVTDLVMSLVTAIYFICTKDKLLAQASKAFYAFLNEKQFQYGEHVVELTNKTFSNFISGQLVEAVIIGVLCYIGAIILQLEYALILAVIIGCTNIIPIFGPIIGTMICAVLLVFVSPIQAVVFIIFGIVLQQFESNLIYPRVVGSSVGLSGVWVLMAVSIGGGLFGMLGMILGLPTFAVLYRLFADEVNKRVAIKEEAKKVIEVEEVKEEINEEGEQ